MAGISAAEYVTYIKILDIDFAANFLVSFGGTKGLDTAFKKFLDDDYFDFILKESNAVKDAKWDLLNIFEFKNYLKQLKEWKSNAKITKFVDKGKFVKHLKLSLTSIALGWVSILIDAVLVFFRLSYCRIVIFKIWII